MMRSAPREQSQSALVHYVGGQWLYGRARAAGIPIGVALPLGFGAADIGRETARPVTGWIPRFGRGRNHDLLKAKQRQVLEDFVSQSAGSDHQNARRCESLFRPTRG